MNILILGATGRVGHEILNHAINDDHHINVLVRNKEKLKTKYNQLNIIEGNVLNKDDIAQAIKGVDVVFSALGTDGTTTLTEAMPLIIEAMEQEGVKRIITIGTAGILQSRTDIDLFRYESNESKEKRLVQRKNTAKYMNYSTNLHLNGQLFVLRIYLMEKELANIEQRKIIYLKIALKSPYQILQNSLINS